MRNCRFYSFQDSCVTTTTLVNLPMLAMSSYSSEFNCNCAGFVVIIANKLINVTKSIKINIDNLKFMNEELSLLLVPGQLCDDNYIGELTRT